MNSKTRLASIDTLRGMVMLHIMGGVVVMKSLAAFLPAAAGAWLVAQMSHAPWGADRIHDYVYPTFLFLTGVSWPFSLASQVARGRTTAQIHRKILLRMTVLILLGLVCGGILRLDWVHIRLASVLGRIGIAWAVAAFIFMHTGFRRQLAICAACSSATGRSFPSSRGRTSSSRRGRVRFRPPSTASADGWTGTTSSCR